MCVVHTYLNPYTCELLIGCCVLLLCWSVLRYRIHLQRQLDQRILEIQKLLIRDIHDGLGGITTNISFTATLGRRETDLQKKDEWLDKLQLLAEEANTELRELMNELECTSMEWPDVIDAIRRISNTAFDGRNITAQISEEGALPKSTPGLLAGMSIIRLARECINNIAKHAEADKTEIILKFSGNHFHLSILDNGCGFDPKTVRRGRGLNHLDKRVSELRGSWRIDTTTGTFIVIDIPLPLRITTKNTLKPRKPS